MGWVLGNFDPAQSVGCRFACAWALVDFAAGGAAAGGADGSGVMMLTGGIAAEFAKSTVIGRPDGTPGSRPAAGDGAAAAALAQDAEWRAISVS